MKKQQISVVKDRKNHYELISHQITLNRKLSDGAKALYLYLASHSDYFTITQENTAKYLNKDIRTIRRLIAELKQSGFLTIEQKPNSNNYNYILHDEPSNQEYNINKALDAYEKNHKMDLEYQKLIFESVDKNKHLTKETIERIKTYIYKIVNTKWINK